MGSFRVALRKESVDRNFDTMQIVIIVVESLSARRAWIEICTAETDITLIGSLSARRAWIEILYGGFALLILPGSLSARRAWIEITVVGVLATLVTVALRKESVDRNRTPHHIKTRPMPSLSARRAWIEMFV